MRQQGLAEEVTSVKLTYGVYALISRPMILYVINVVIFLVVLIPYQLLRLGKFEPYNRGFFCDDQSINLPYKESTVPSPLNVGLSITIPFLTIVIFQTVLAKLRPIECLDLGGSLSNGGVPGQFRRIIIQLFYYALGFCLTGLLTDVGKYTVGRLRPNFLKVCKPSYNLSNCVDNHGIHQYMYSEKWCTGDPNEIHESRYVYHYCCATIAILMTTFM
jgi:phosphatidate phosphatase